MAKKVTKNEKSSAILIELRRSSETRLIANLISKHAKANFENNASLSFIRIYLFDQN